jgi:hypothetical protein
MTLVDPWPSFRQALLRRLRSNLVLKAALSGDWSEGTAPPATSHPLGLISLHYSPADYDWTGVTTIIGFDVFVVAKDSGQAASLSQLVFATLQDAKLTPTGQTSLTCRRVSSISLTDEDQEGTSLWQLGGVWQAITVQSNPTYPSLSFTIDSDIA